MFWSGYSSRILGFLRLNLKGFCRSYFVTFFCVGGVEGMKEGLLATCFRGRHGITLSNIVEDKTLFPEIKILSGKCSVFFW